MPFGNINTEEMLFFDFLSLPFDLMAYAYCQDFLELDTMIACEK